MSKHRPFKGTERSVAKLLGGKRLGHLGAVDVKTRWVSAEVKHRQTLPAWLVQAMSQAKRHAETEQLPVVILHIAGQQHASNLVVMQLSDFVDFFGEMEKETADSVV